MLFFVWRWVFVATSVFVAALLVENAAEQRRGAVLSKPRGWFHQRALHAYELKQLAVRDSVVRIAQAQLGIPYVLGGTSPSHGFDCSGLVRFVFAHVRFVPPRTAHQQSRIGQPVEPTLLRPGDLVTFGEPDSVTHIGIYIGDGRFVHASSVAGKVIVSPLERPPAESIKPFVGARRIVASARI